MITSAAAAAALAVEHFEAGCDRTVPRGRARSLGYHDLDAAVAQVLRVSVPLAAEPDDRYGLTV